MWLSMTFRPGPDLQETAVFRFELEGHPNRNHDVNVTGSQFQVGPALTGLAGARLRSDADAYLLFIYGRINSSSPRLQVEAKPGLMEQFEVWFKGL